jgi:hypothetical protein
MAAPRSQWVHLNGRIVRKSLIVPILVGVFILSNTAKSDLLVSIGGVSCGTWTDWRRPPKGYEASAAEAWMLGFLFGAGWEGPDDVKPLEGLDAQAVWAWVDNYCRVHPLVQLWLAGNALIQERRQEHRQ